MSTPTDSTISYRPAALVDRDAVDRAVAESNRAACNRLWLEAHHGCDHDAMARLGPVLASHKGGHLGTGMTYARLLASIAAAFAGPPPAGIGDVPAFTERIAQSLPLVIMELGLDAPKRVADLAVSRQLALEFIEALQETANDVVAGEWGVPRLVRRFAKIGRLDLADGLARQALMGDDPWPSVTLASTYRDVVRDPQRAAELNSEALAVNPNFVPAMNSLCASFVDMGRVEDGLPHLLKALALRPDSYAGRTGGRAFAVAGKTLQSKRCWTIAHVWDGSVVLDSDLPLKTPEVVCQALAWLILADEQRADLAQLPLTQLSTAALVGAADPKLVVAVAGRQPCEVRP